MGAKKPETVLALKWRWYSLFLCLWLCQRKFIFGGLQFCFPVRTYTGKGGGCTVSKPFRYKTFLHVFGEDDAEMIGGDVLRYIRIKRGIQAVDVARRLQLSRTTISRFEHGHLRLSRTNYDIYMSMLRASPRELKMLDDFLTFR